MASSVTPEKRLGLRAGVKRERSIVSGETEEAEL